MTEKNWKVTIDISKIGQKNTLETYNLSAWKKKIGCYGKRAAKRMLYCAPECQVSPTGNGYCLAKDVCKNYVERKH
ncbi:hypothetical protein [Dysgonomonas termitidis]|uniref:Uncharacterized protein n=1 Tax=Dysgonomonas termitidis TaxID=1516126 RepID=A0ABV9L2J5_9BACT